MLSVERLRELLRYDAETGNFIRRVSAGKRPAGALAGTRSCEGYWQISVDGKVYFAHRLVWLWFNGEFPKGNLDHIDMDKLNNRYENLRPVNHSLNTANTLVRKNNRTGLKGIGATPSGAFRARIFKHGKEILLGTFKDEASAATAYDVAASEHFGEYFRSGLPR